MPAGELEIFVVAHGMMRCAEGSSERLNLRSRVVSSRTYSLGRITAVGESNFDVVVSCVRSEE